MIEIAAAKKLYTQLVHGDIDSALRRLQGNFDLMLALDVFIYIGDLEGMFAATGPRFAPGGMFVYSIETAVIDSFELRTTGHYVHNADYVIVTAENYGLKHVGGKTVILREEAGKRVPAYIGILQKA